MRQTFVGSGFNIRKLLAEIATIAAMRGLPEAAPKVAQRIDPTGGIVEVQLPDYLAQPNVLCVGGSWLVRHESIAGGDYGSVRDAAQRARTCVDATRPVE